MVEKIVTDKRLIRGIINRDAKYLIIQYNTRNKRAWFRTDTMTQKKAISLSRVINL